ncbi:hypothetical protein ACIOJ9_28795 [Streptomyces sp. NPDC088175]|uniref:hypothetical protein n=1 Tax=unclassified Streptomyces TaxID=2593676 RepID=UPI00382DD9DE
MSEAPQHPDVTVQLSGEDGNVYSVIGIVQKALRRAGHHEAATAFGRTALGSQSYDEVIQLAMRTVDVS